MNFLRATFLLLTIAAVSLSSKPGFAQQEVDPDHYDQAVTSKQSVKAPIRKSTAQKQNQAKTNVASRRAKHHVSKPAA